jgi:hypothetical protein
MEKRFRMKYKRDNPLRGRFSPAGFKQLAVLTSLLLVLVSLGCSVQELALIKVAFVQDRIAVPTGQRALTIRVNRVGTWRQLTPVTAETSFCDVEGDFTLKTTKIGPGFVVARGTEFDIGYAPVFIENFGDTVSLGQLIPATSPALIAKTPGESLFVLFEEDFEPEYGKITSVDLVGPTTFELDVWATSMFDDGSLVDIDPATAGVQTSGDFAAGDGVWTVRTTKFPAGKQQYGFFLNKDDLRGLQRDPYEEASDDHSVILVK